MKFSASIATLASLAAAAPGAVPVNSNGVDVKLELQDNSKVKAVLTNSGKENIKVLKTGSILDDTPVKKASVSGSNGDIAFEGVRVYLAPETAGESAFQEIAAGESVEVTFDVAEVFDLSNGGDFDIQSAGNLQYAQGGDIKNLGSLSYESNKINAKVDGATAAQSLSIFQALTKRATVSNDCSGSRRTAVETAVQNTHDIAVKAAEAARNGPDNKMVEYFESAGQSTRDTVATAFDKMANAYASSGGKPDLHCSDIQNYCRNGAVAYALPPSNTIVYCDAWFDYPTLNEACRQVDQAHIAVHEATHLSMVKGTEDYNTYGYQNSVDLSARYNLNHADTYAYFAHDTLSGC